MNYSTMTNLAKAITSISNELKEQEVKYLTNPRCKKPDFSVANYYLGVMAKAMGKPEPTPEEAEAAIRASW